MVPVLVLAVCDTALINVVPVVEILFIVVWADVESIMVGVIAIVLKLALPAGVPSGVGAGMPILAGTMLGVLTKSGIAALRGLRAKLFAVVMTASEFPVPTPLEEFSRWPAFDCRLLALSAFARVVHT